MRLFTEKAGFIRNAMFRDTQYACFISNPIYLTFCRSPFVFVNINFFLGKGFFCFIVLTGCFSFNFGLICLYLIIFFWIIVFFSCFYCNFFESELTMISSFFFYLHFVRKTVSHFAMHLLLSFSPFNRQ